MAEAEVSVAAEVDSVAEGMDTVAVVKGAVTVAEVGAATAAVVVTGVTVATATASPATRRATLPMATGGIELDSMPLWLRRIGLRRYLIIDLVYFSGYFVLDYPWIESFDIVNSVFRFCLFGKPVFVLRLK